MLIATKKIIQAASGNADDVRVVPSRPSVPGTHIRHEHEVHALHPSHHGLSGIEKGKNNMFIM